MKSHSKALVFFAVSKQILVVYSADRGRAEINFGHTGLSKQCRHRSIGSTLCLHCVYTVCILLTIPITSLGHILTGDYSNFAGVHFFLVLTVLLPLVIINVTYNFI